MLTPKQQRFVEEYLIDLNATQAAIRAGYSQKTAHSIGHENLSKPEIAAALQEAQEKRSESVGIDAEWILREAEDLYRECRETKDLRTAKGTLELAGKHVGVNAFKDTHDHRHSGTMQIVSGIKDGVNSIEGGDVESD